MDKSLQGQTVLVTGATGGIGAAIVERLAQEGARPIIHFKKDEMAAQALLDRIGCKGITLQADFSNADGAFGLWRRAVEFAGRIHGLVNSAGIRSDISIDSSPQDWRVGWQAEFQINFHAAADLCREAIRHFKTEGGGRIVNISSRAGQRGSSADAMPYGATKAALINLTKSIAHSFGREGVTAVTIAPGWVRTPVAKDLIVTHDNLPMIEDIPIGDMAEPEEIAELVAFVLRYSQESLNGATLDVNGGSYIR